VRTGWYGGPVQHGAGTRGEHGVICGLCAAVTTVLLILVHADGAHLSQLPMALPSAVLDGLLAWVVVPLVRGAVRTEALRAPHPVGELSVERAGG
jgi:hypothetical protein